MKPGRELDALVAEKVMGWKRLTEGELHPHDFDEVYPSAAQAGFDRTRVSEWWFKVNQGGEPKLMCRVEDFDDYDEQHISGFKPSTDISSAWEVVEWATKRFPECRFTLDHLWGFKAPENWWRAAWCPINDVGDSERSNVIPEARGDSAPHAICLAALKAVSEGSPPTP